MRRGRWKSAEGAGEALVNPDRGGGLGDRRPGQASDAVHYFLVLGAARALTISFSRS